MYRFAITVCLCIAAFTAPAIAGEFTRYYGKQTVFEGDGGEMKQVEGVDVWTNGSPPRRYELLGYIHDRRHASGIVGMMRIKSLIPQTAKLARANGGDAIMLVSSENDVVGFGSTGNATFSGNTASGVSFTGPIAKRESRFAVIRYLPDAEIAPATPTSENPAAQPLQDAPVQQPSSSVSE